MLTERKRKEHTSNQPPWFVGRKEQLSAFSSMTERLNPLYIGKPLPSNLSEYYGPPGIGKTSLIRREVEICVEKSIPYSHIDFAKDQDRNEQYRKDPLLFFEDNVSQIKQKIIALDTSKFDSAAKDYRNQKLPEEGIVKAYYDMDQETKLYKRPEWLVKLRTTVIEFIKLVNTQSTETPVPIVFFFDHMESLDIDTVDFIEEWMVNPIIQIKHAAVVTSTPLPWRWKRPEIRRRLTSEEIPVFDINETNKQVELEGGIGLNVYTMAVESMTGGHPGANSAAILTLKDATKKHGTPIPEGEREAVGLAIGESIFRYIQESIFSGKTAELKSALTEMAMVRLFDSTLLKQILSVFNPEVFSQKNGDFFVRLLNELKKTDLLEWDKGYSIAKALRYPIQKYILSTNPELFKAMNEAAIEVYKNWLKKPVDNRIIFIEELLYHTALKSLAERTEKSPEERTFEMMQVLIEQLTNIKEFSPDPGYQMTFLNKLTKQMVNLQKDLSKFSPNSFQDYLGEQLIKQIQITQESLLQE